MRAQYVCVYKFHPSTSTPTIFSGVRYARGSFAEIKNRLTRSA